MKLLQETIQAIRPLDQAVMAATQKEIDYCLKPPGSLGKLEDIVRQIAGITGKVHNRINKKAIVVMMADNGVCTEGVAMYPQDVTRIGADFVTSGRMGVNFLAKYAEADIIAVDIGIGVDIDCPKALHRKIRHGTANFLKAPAMEREEAVAALETGRVRMMPISTATMMLINTGCNSTAHIISSPVCVMAAAMAGPANRAAAMPAISVAAGVAMMSTGVVLLTSLPVSAPTVTAIKQPTGPPSAAPAKPTAVADNKTSGGAFSA